MEEKTPLTSAFFTVFSNAIEFDLEILSAVYVGIKMWEVSKNERPPETVKSSP